jgi:multiple sugar transport system permease protein/sn-glycerol 3-phosphate transport system permease protein
MLKGKVEREFNGVLFLLPAFIIISIFYIYPLFKTIAYAFFFTGTSGEILEFAGLENFIELFTDVKFYNSLIVTFKFVFYTVIFSILIALLLAIACNEKLKGIPFFRTIFSSTMGVSISAASTIVLFMFHPSVGVINNILVKIGIIPVNWFTDSRYALTGVIISTIWMNIGFGFIIITAGLQNISKEVEESCLVDGTKYFPKLFKITLPLITPSLFYLLITTILKSFQSFGQIDIMTGGGPVNSTNILVYSLYRTAFVDYRFDYASVKGIVLLLIISIVMFIKFKLERKVHY